MEWLSRRATCLAYLCDDICTSSCFQVRSCAVKEKSKSEVDADKKGKAKEVELNYVLVELMACIVESIGHLLRYCVIINDKLG